MHGLASEAFFLMQLVFEINCHMDLLRRDARVRVKMWLEKLRQAPIQFCWSLYAVSVAHQLRDTSTIPVASQHPLMCPCTALLTGPWPYNEPLKGRVHIKLQPTAGRRRRIGCGSAIATCMLGCCSRSSVQGSCRTPSQPFLALVLCPSWAAGPWRLTVHSARGAPGGTPDHAFHLVCKISQILLAPCTQYVQCTLNYLVHPEATSFT